LLTHHLRHRVLADVLAAGLEGLEHPRAAVHAAVLLVHRLDLLGQLPPAPCRGAGRPVPPGVVARAADLQDLAAHLHRELWRKMLFDEAELHGCSFAKNAAAFFKISRSINSRAFSFLSLLSSACRAPSPEG